MQYSPMLPLAIFDILSIIMKYRKVEIESIFLKKLHSIFTRHFTIVKFYFRVATEILATLRVYLELSKVYFSHTASGLLLSLLFGRSIFQVSMISKHFVPY